MIMRNKKYPVIFIHLFCWMIFFFFPIFLSQRENGTVSVNELIHHLSMPVSLCIIFYINFLGMIPRWLFRGRPYIFAGGNLVFILLFGIGLRLLGEYLVPFQPPHFIKPQNLPPRILFMLRDVTTLVFAVGLSIAIRLSIRWREAEDARKEAEKSKAETELMLLRNQLNPHFLLNTLNNIYALIAFDTEKAQEAVQDLSKLLRYVLYENQSNLVSLNREVNFIKNYIDLMRIRLSDNVTVETEFNIRPDSKTSIAPMIFISLIENAFKHGVSATDSGFIRIVITEDTTGICCDICNSLHPKDKSDKSGSGIGLKQVRKRLQLYYPGQYSWTRKCDPDKKIYSSVIHIFHSSEHRSAYTI